jgi:muramidase (phage lysozyme)
MSEKQANLLENPNVRTFLDFLGKAEGADYNVIVGGGKFEDFSKHPGIVGLRTKSGPSTAAGKYQITKRTYNDIAPKLKITDFSPESQDRIAVALIRRRGALNDVVNGNWNTAIEKLGKEWASLPTSPYAQPKKDWKFVAANLPKSASAAVAIAPGVVPAQPAVAAAEPAPAPKMQRVSDKAPAPAPAPEPKKQEPRTIADVGELPESYRIALATNYLGDTEDESVADKALAMLEESEEEEASAPVQNTGLQYLQTAGLSIDPYQFLRQEVAQTTDQGPRRRVVPQMPQTFSDGGEANKDTGFDPLQALQRLENYRLQVTAGGGASGQGSGFGGRATVSVPLSKDLEARAYLEGYGQKPRGQSFQGDITGGGVSLVKRFSNGGSASKSGVNRLKQARAVPAMPKFQEGGDVDYNQLAEQMTVGAVPEQTAPSPVDTAVNEYLRMQSKIVTDPKEWLRTADQRLKESIEKDPTEFALNFTGAGIAGITRRPGGNFFLNPESNLGERIKSATESIHEAFLGGRINMAKEKAATEMFTKKARDFFSKRAGSVDDELKRELIEGRMGLSKEDEIFPDFLLDAAKKGNPAAMRELEQRYDDMLGIKGFMRVENDDIMPRQIEGNIKQGMLAEFKKNPSLIPDDLLYRLTNKDPAEVRARITENPELFSTIIEPKLSKLITPDIELVSKGDIEKYKNLYKKLAPDNLTANEQEAFKRGQEIYDIGLSRNMFGNSLEDLANQALKMDAKELADIDFATFVRRATKLANQEKNILAQGEKVAEALSKGKTPDKEWLSFGMKPFVNARDGFVWKQVVNPDATIIQGKALNNSIAGYSRYGAYGPFNNGRKALDDGTVNLYVLYNKEGIPVTHVESVKGLKPGEITFRQVFGNGPLTGNVMPKDYLPQVKDLIRKVEPKDVPFGLAQELRNYVEPFAKGGMVVKPLYDRAG